MKIETNPMGAPRCLAAMCVDDSQFDLKLNERILARSGAFEPVLQCASAAQALQQLRDGAQPDVIFLDVNMPMMDGFEFLDAALQEFGAAFEARVVIMLTSSLNPKDEAHAEGYAPVRGFLAKPLTVEDARAVARRVSGMEYANG